MSTRTSIIVSFGRTRIYLYRHCDGYPAETGAYIVQKLRAHPDDASRFVQALLDERYEKQSYEPEAKRIYELASELHGDVQWVYAVRFETTWRRRFHAVACLPVAIGDDAREPHKAEYTELSALIDRVNADRREINARLDARRMDGDRYDMLVAEDAPVEPPR